MKILKSAVYAYTGRGGHWAVSFYLIICVRALGGKFVYSICVLTF